MAGFRQLVFTSAGISLLNLAGKGLGFAKTLIIAAVFGASAELDAFWVAMILPAFLPNLFKTVLITAFVPRYMSNLVDSDSPDGWRGANTLLSVVMLLMLLATGVLVAFPGPLVQIIAPGLAPDVSELATSITRLLATATLAMGLVAVLTAVMHARQMFVIAAMDAIVINIFTIGFIAVFVRDLGIYAIAYGVIAGYIAQALLLIGASATFLLPRYRPAFSLRHPDFTGPVNHMIPLVVGNLAAVALFVVDNIFASFLTDGSISAMNYGTMIAMLPVQIFVLAIMTVFYPPISREFSQGTPQGVVRDHNRAVRVLLIGILPSAAVLVVFGGSIVSVLLERGEFSANDTTVTAGVVMAIGLGLVGHALMLLNFRTLNAILKPWLQVRIGLLGVVLNAALDALLYRPFGIAGIALASSISVTLVAFLAGRALERELGGRIGAPAAAAMARMALMSIALVGTAWLAKLGFSLLWPSMAGSRIDDWVGLLALLPASVVFVAVGRRLGVDEAEKFFELVAGVVGRTRPDTR